MSAWPSRCGHMQGLEFETGSNPASVPKWHFIRGTWTLRGYKGLQICLCLNISHSKVDCCRSRGVSTSALQIGGGQHGGRGDSKNCIFGGVLVAFIIVYFEVWWNYQTDTQQPGTPFMGWSILWVTMLVCPLFAGESMTTHLTSPGGGLY